MKTQELIDHLKKVEQYMNTPEYREKERIKLLEDYYRIQKMINKKYAKYLK